MESKEKRRWLDDSRNVDKIFYGVVVICALSVAADLLYHKHTHYSWEEFIGFHAWYGFVGCVFLVLTAKLMRRILMRDEDYYD